MKDKKTKKFEQEKVLPHKYITSKDSPEIARKIKECSREIMKRNAEAYRELANR